MRDKLKGIFIALIAVVALAAGGAAIAGAVGGDDDDGSSKRITGSALDKASAAALDHTGGGRVTETEVGDEEGYYEVEVTRSGGKQVDVHLDRDFKVLSGQADGDDGSKDDGPNDD